MTNLLSLYYPRPAGLGRNPRLFGDFERLFGDLDAWFRPESSLGSPRIQSSTTAEGYQLSVDLPGLGDADVHVDLHEGVLTISGERAVNPPEGFRATRRERGTLKFSHRVRLPKDVDEASVGASMKDGVLSVKLPRRPETKPRQIPVGTH